MPGTQPTPLHRGSDSPEYDEQDSGSNGAASTARDLAAFLQMLLNRGAYGGKQILSQASVAAMARHQVDSSIPWLMPLLNPTTGKRIEFEFRGGGYGYGLFIFGPGDRFRPNGALASRSAFGHLGYATAFIWADPERELLGVYLTVVPRLHRDLPIANTDLFQNAVHAAVVD